MLKNGEEWERLQTQPFAISSKALYPVEFKYTLLWLPSKIQWTNFSFTLIEEQSYLSPVGTKKDKEVIECFFIIIIS